MRRLVSLLLLLLVARAPVYAEPGVPCCGLGEAHLGQNIGDLRNVLGFGVQSLRNLPGIVGVTFLGRNDSLLGVTYNVETRTLESLSLQAPDPAVWHQLKRYSNYHREGKAERTVDFTDWVLEPGLALGQSRLEVTTRLGLDWAEAPAKISTLHITFDSECKIGRTVRVEEDFIVVRLPHSRKHWVRVDFVGERVSGFYLSFLESGGGLKSSDS